MDYTILYMFLAIGIAFGVSYLVSHLRRKDIVKQEDIRLAMDLLGIGMKIISELNLHREAEIANISQIVLDSLEYAISFYDTEKDVIHNAYSYSLELCDVVGIELTNSRRDLLMELITIVFNDKYIKFIEK